MYTVKSFFTLLSILLGGVLLPFALFSQQPTRCDYVRPHEADQWTFGQRSQIDFSSGNPIALAMPGNIEFIIGAATISDEEGNLLFLSDGMNIWTNGYYLLDGTSDLFGNKAAAQSALFVPVPGNADRYLLFTVDMYLPGIFTHGVRVSTLDRVNGLWSISTKNQLIMNSNAQKITAVKDANERDYWVIVHGYGDVEGAKFFVYKVSDSGLDINPVISETGTKHSGFSGTLFNNNGGYMKASSNGKKIALVIPDDGIVEVFDFDTSTGSVSLETQSAVGALDYPFGVEFSPDNTKLYVSTAPLGTSVTSYVYQYDLDTPGYLNNPFVVASIASTQVPGDDFLIGALQLGVDGKIYLANLRMQLLPLYTLGVINNPNRKGIGCNFNEVNHAVGTGFPLAGTASLVSLPNFVTSFLDIPHFSFINHCHTEITSFKLRNETNIDNISWNFDDGGASSVILEPEFTFSNPGNYTVTATETYNGISYPFSREIEIYPLPAVDLGENIIYILPNTSITLDAGEWDEYLWSPDGSTERYLDVNQEGVYTVTVTDTNCCTNDDTVEIRFANIYVPNAFKPTSAIVENKSFKVFGPLSALQDFDFKVFNRWGQLLFETNDPDKGWDGTFKGGDASDGVYVWVLNFKSMESRYQAAQSFTQHGTVTLLR